VLNVTSLEAIYDPVADRGKPAISFIVPCYNEEEIVGYTIPRLITAFDRAAYRLQLIAVDNGSRDGTGQILKELAATNKSVVYHRVETNEGYGNGVLSAIPLCAASLIGIIPADGQVDAEDVVLLYEAAVAAKGRVLAKARRRFRMDGPLRTSVSFAYNLLVRILWPRLGSFDVNGSPKILPRDVLISMRPKSKEWFLDPEIMIKAHYMGVRVLEFNVFSRVRNSGTSHVRMWTCWEFFWKLLYYRFSRDLSRWRQRATAHG
jgi:glycosyltransferase involved in cell wall biosynthesis